MYKNALTAMLTFVICCVSMSGSAADKYDPFARDIKILSQWFEGEFNNEEQRWFEKHPHSAIAKDDHHQRIHTAHKRLDLPEFGEHVFYVEEYVDNDPEKVVRQRFVTFKSEPENNAIRMQQGFFRDRELAKGAHLAPEKLANITQADVFFMTDLDPDSQCDVFWHRVGDQFEGEIKGKECLFGEEEKRRYSVHKMILSASKYWRADATFLLSDNSLYIGHSEDNPMKMRRANIFSCEASNRTAGVGSAIRSFRLHDQGGTGAFTRESDGKAFEVLLRNKEYPFYETRPDFLYFSFRYQGKERSIVYTVNDVDSRVLGLNHDGISVFCHREGYKFRESLEQL